MYMERDYFHFHRGKLHKLSCEKWPTVDEKKQQKMACMAAASAWGLSEFMNCKKKCNKTY